MTKGAKQLQLSRHTTLQTGELEATRVNQGQRWEHTEPVREGERERKNWGKSTAFSSIYRERYLIRIKLLQELHARMCVQHVRRVFFPD